MHFKVIHNTSCSCMFGQARVYLSKYLIFLRISELSSIKQPKNSPQLPKPTVHTRKIQIKLTIIGSGLLHSAHGLAVDKFQTYCFLISFILAVSPQKKSPTCSCSLKW